jgi:hypothetical protein
MTPLMTRARTAAAATGLVAGVVAATVAVASGPAGAAPSTFLGGLGSPHVVASTVPTSGPAAGDQNPYGVAVVPHSVGDLVHDDVLVSNFNDGTNQQGTGTTIMQVDPHRHKASVFARIDPSALGNKCPGGVGLTTALAVFSQGWVVVGSLPADVNHSFFPAAGCLIVLDSEGHVVKTISGSPIDGPWDMVGVPDLDGDGATLFVTNVLNGITMATPSSPDGGTVVRVRLEFSGMGAPRVVEERVIARGFPETTDPNAFVIGPTGVGVDGDTVYVANSPKSEIDSIPDAFDRHTAAAPHMVTSGGLLNDPLGLVIAPNDDIVTMNGGDGNAVETTPGGHQVAYKTLDANLGGGGNLFGAAVTPQGGLYFVDDFGGSDSLPAANNLMVTPPTDH